MSTFLYHYAHIGLLAPYSHYFELSSYENYFGLSIFDSLLDTLVKFSNICLISQNPYMDYTGLIPTKINLDFCWLFSGVNFYSKFEFIKLLSILRENFDIQT